MMRLIAALACCAALGACATSTGVRSPCADAMSFMAGEGGHACDFQDL